MRHKYEAFAKFKEWKTKVETQTRRKVRYLQSDHGGEYKSKTFEDFNKAQGVTRYFITPYTPQQNGVVERMNKNLLEQARYMRMNASLSNVF